MFVCGGSRTSRTGAPLLCGTFPHQPSLPTLCFLCWLRLGFHLFCNGFLLWRPRLAVPPVALLAAAMSYSMSSPAWLPLFSFSFCFVPPRLLRFLVSCSTPPRHRVWSCRGAFVYFPFVFHLFSGCAFACVWLLCRARCASTLLLFTSCGFGSNLNPDPR